MFHKLQREPFRWQGLFLYLPSEEINKPGIVAESRSMHVHVDPYLGRQACGRIADRGEATLIDGCFCLLAPDIIE